jgi:hypothetical protein
MKVGRLLTALAACAVASLAIATAAQAAPSQSAGGAAAGIHANAKPSKVKGAAYYNDYFDPYFDGEFLGYQLEPPFWVSKKAKVWGYEFEPGDAVEYGNIEELKVKYKEGHVTVKYTITYFRYNDVGEGAECAAINDKTGYEDGECIYLPSDEFFGVWYAEKVKK